jgi:hypothetical protein
MDFGMRVVWGTLLLLAACSTDRVSTELDQFSDHTAGVAAAIAPRLVPGLRAEAEEELRIAAEARDAWFLDDTCPQVIDAVPSLSLDDCTILKIPNGDREPYVGQARALDRRMTVLTAYVDALDALSNAALEEEVVESYAGAIAALKSLGKTAESESLAAFVAEREERQDKVSAVVTEAIAAMRYARLRDVVTASDAAVQDLVREIQLGAILLGLEPSYAQRVRELRQVNEEVILSAVTGPTDLHLANLKLLEAELESYKEYYSRTLLYDLGLIARFHHDLAAALRDPGSTEDVIAYLGSLKDLKDKLEE